MAYNRDEEHRDQDRPSQPASGPAPVRAGSRPQPTLVERASSKVVLEPPRPRAHALGRYVEPGRGPGARRAELSFLSHYELSDPLGEGAMGEVLVARDRQILREVAMKRLHRDHLHSRPDLRERFLREARIQGQLEHPSVVPVYEIGVDDDGREYFTMKRVRGCTLEQVISGLREEDPKIRSEYSPRKLLTAMSRVCLAVAYAHEHGVVHRDLKPANIMLGDYGEVHVLDWGIAKVLDQSEPVSERPLETGERRVQRTQVGVLVGTPGYMAPEQARGETRTYGGRSDIYALGAILFEIMTLEPLHLGSRTDQILMSTVSGAEARPSVRTPEHQLPAELDEILARATALNPEHRYATARELNDDLERLLDGDRDTRRRAEIAAQHAANAKAALVVARRGGPEADGQHRRAVGELLQALALEPENGEARATLVQLLLEPVERLPEAAFTELSEVNRLDRARASRANVMAFLAWGMTTPLLFLMGVRDLHLLLGMTGVGFVIVAYTAWMALTGRTQRKFMTVAVGLSFALVAASATFFGPLFFVPGLSVATATSYLVAIRANRRSRYLVLLASMASVLLPTIAHLYGWLSPRYAFEHGGITILPGLVDLPETATWAFLLATNCLTVVTANVLVGRAVASLLRAERRLFAQAWRLRQFLPELSPTPRGK